MNVGVKLGTPSTASVQRRTAFHFANPSARLNISELSHFPSCARDRRWCETKNAVNRNASCVCIYVCTHLEDDTSRLFSARIHFEAGAPFSLFPPFLSKMPPNTRSASTTSAVPPPFPPASTYFCRANRNSVSSLPAYLANSSVTLPSFCGANRPYIASIFSPMTTRKI